MPHYVSQYVHYTKGIRIIISYSTERSYGSGRPNEGGEFSFTRRDIREFSGWGHYRVHTHLNELLELQYVLSDVRGPAGPHRYRLASLSLIHISEPTRPY